MDLHIILFVTFGSIISLIGTMIGASVGVFIKEPGKRFLGTIMGFAGGLMFSVVAFDLIPEAVKEWNLLWTLIFCSLGMLIIIFIDVTTKLPVYSHNSYLKVAYMAAIALMLHNLPEGIIMGCGFLAGSSLGIKMCLVIAIHDIPEGMAVAAPLMASKVRIRKILLFAFLTAFPTAIGTIIGAFIGSISKEILSASLSLASGIMLYVVCGEMLPESNRIWSGLTSTLGVLGGILMGLFITGVLK